MAGTIMPSPWFTGLDDNGNPVVGGRLYSYAAGTSTPIPMYTDIDLSVAHPNPAILDGAGRITCYFLPASYKLILKDASDVTIRTQDNVTGFPTPAPNTDVFGVAGETISAGQVVYLSDGSGGLIAGRWYLARADLAYASSLPEVGMAPSPIPATTTGLIRLLGKIDVAYTVAPGVTYFVSNTPGAVATAAGTNVRVVGVADSTTSLVIVPNPPPQAIGGGPPPYAYTYQEVALVDGATVAIDCNASLMDGTKMFVLAAGANRVILAPTNAQPGMRMILRHYANGAPFTLSLTGGAGGFRFGTDIPALTATAANKSDYIGSVYNGSFWDVVATTKGF